MQLRSSRVLMTLLGAGAALTLLLATNSLAQTPQVFTRADVAQWLNKYRDAKPDFKPGDVISGGDIEKLRPFVPPGSQQRGSRAKAAQRPAACGTAAPATAAARRSSRHRSASLCLHPFPRTDCRFARRASASGT